MPPRDSARRKQSIGDVLRKQRIDVLQKGLREMAGELGIAPAHLTDLEKGRRTPSQDLLLRIAKAYRIPEAELRAGWSRAEEVVNEIATQDSVTAEKVPAFLRTARKLTPDQWDRLIEQARKMGGKKTSR